MASFTERGQTSGGIGFGGKVKDSVLDMLVLKCLLRNLSGDFSRLLNTWVWKS